MATDNSPQITLYDFHSRPPSTSWSSGPWRIRLLLNYKGIPVTTHLLEYPELRPYMIAKGIPANGEGTSAYTLPLIKIHDPATGKDEYIMDSDRIARYICEQYPEPAFIFETVEDGARKRLTEKMRLAFPPTMPLIMPAVAKHVLTEGSVDYFKRTREEFFGMSLEELERKEGGEKGYEALRGPWKDVAAVFAEIAGDGPFIYGRRPSYVDFVLCGTFITFKRVDPRVWEEVVRGNAAFKTLWEACQPWMRPAPA